MTVQADMKRWPLKVTKPNRKPKIEVKWSGKTIQFTAEEISSVVLLEMKKTAEAHLGEKVTSAVITVPANFNSNQRQATINAGKIAGLNVMRITSKPMATALSHGPNMRIDSHHNVFIFDLGSGIFDASIMSKGKRKFEVKAVDDDAHLGGGDFDSRLVNYCVEKFKQEHGGIYLTTNAKAISHLRKACETAKKKLGSLECTGIDVESLCEEIDFTVSISRCQFEQLCSDLFERLLTIEDKVLRDAKLDKANVHDI
ncbi:Heat shock cognate 70 kDa protein [Taenia solium]|eukprot:TsM_001217000 transcript=TsM_001217000 gene=TsM_001217000